MQRAGPHRFEVEVNGLTYYARPCGVGEKGGPDVANLVPPSERADESPRSALQLADGTWRFLPEQAEPRDDERSLDAEASGATVEQAWNWLRGAGAPSRLLRHAELVGGTAERLIEALDALCVSVDDAFTVAGAIVHDIGKVDVPEELHEPGSRHESAGRILLTAVGAPHSLARVCESHGQWREMPCALEELVVVLADKLWKGKRESEVELLVIDRVAARLGVGRFDVFPVLDAVFERIAADGDDQLRASLEDPTI